MLGRPNKREQMFAGLKAMFPHIDLTVIHQDLSFSENLQILVAQLGTPKVSQTQMQIENMKQAVDKQELKIQKSLVNEEDVLGNITNRSERRQRQQRSGKGQYRIQTIQQQESSVYWNNEENIYEVEKNVGNKNDMISDLMSDMWDLEPENGKDWFHH